MTDIQKKIQELRASLEALNMPEDAIQAAIKKATAHVKEPAREEVNAELLKAVNSVINKKAVKDHLMTIQEGGFTASFAFKVVDGDLEITEVRTRIAGTRSSSKSSGKRATIVCGGKEYSTFAELCSGYSLEVGGDSARRVYERFHTQDPGTYPAYEEV